MRYMHFKKAETKVSAVFLSEGLLVREGTNQGSGDVLIGRENTSQCNGDSPRGGNDTAKRGEYPQLIYLLFFRILLEKGTRWLNQHILILHIYL